MDQGVATTPEYEVVDQLGAVQLATQQSDAKARPLVGEQLWTQPASVAQQTWAAALSQIVVDRQQAVRLDSVKGQALLAYTSVFQL